MRFLRKSEQVVIFVDRLAIGAISLDSWIMKTARKHIMNLRFLGFPTAARMTKLTMSG
jgi:hypothetical protein